MYVFIVFTTIKTSANHDEGQCANFIPSHTYAEGSFTNYLCPYAETTQLLWEQLQLDFVT